MAAVDARKSNLIVLSSVAPSPLISFSSTFSLKITSESGSMLLAILVSVLCRFNTAGTSVTNHPVVYFLGPIRTLLASFLFCDRPIAGDVRGSGDTALLSTFKVGSLAAERLYRVCGSSYHKCQCQIGERGCPSIHKPAYTCRTTGGGPIPCYFPIRPSSPTFVPCLVLSSHPQEKKAARCCRFESPSDSCFISPKNSLL